MVENNMLRKKIRTQLNLSTTAVNHLKETLEKTFPLNSIDNTNPAQLIPFSNELGQAYIIEKMKLIKFKKTESLKIAIIFEEFNFISMLNVMEVDLFIIANNNSDFHSHIKHLLSCLTISDTPAQFIANYRINNPIQDKLTIKHESQIIRADMNLLVDLLTGKQGYVKHSTKEHHFLSNERLYSQCKEAAKKICFAQIHLDQFSVDHCKQFSTLLYRHRALLTFLHFKHFQSHSDLLRQSIPRLVDYFPHCIINYAKLDGISHADSTYRNYFSTGLSTYLKVCFDVIYQCPPATPYTKIFTIKTPPEAILQEEFCYLATYIVGDKTSIQLILDGELNINDCSNQLIAFDEKYKAQLFADKLYSENRFNNLDKESTPIWIFKITGDEKQTNRLLKYYREGQCIRCPEDIDAAGKTFAATIIAVEHHFTQEIIYKEEMNLGKIENNKLTENADQQLKKVASIKLITNEKSLATPSEKIETTEKTSPKNHTDSVKTESRPPWGKKSSPTIFPVKMPDITFTEQEKSHKHIKKFKRMCTLI